jgi:general secretion pathway protein L
MIGEFFLWWFARLADLLPQWLRRSAPSAADAIVIAPVGGLGRDVDAVAIGLRRNGKETPVGRFDLAAPGLAELPRAPGGTTLLRLSGTDVLAKTLTLPLAALSELRQVLTFEMDRETPFRPDELYWNHRLGAAHRQENRLSVRLRSSPRRASRHCSEPSTRSGSVPAGPRSQMVPTPALVCPLWAMAAANTVPPAG